MYNDLSYAIRQLRKNPGFTAVAVLTLALGVGANTTIFTWVDAFLLNGFPGVPEPDQIVLVSSTTENGGFMSMSYPDYVDYRDHNQGHSGLVVTDMAAMSLTLDGNPERVWGLLVSGNYFDALAVRPTRGRGFLPEEDKTPGSHPVLVMGYGLWQRGFAGNPDLVGKTVTLNNHLFTVVGIAPQEFHGTYIGLNFDVYVPMMMQELIVPGNTRLTQRGSRWLDSLARLRPDLSRDQAQTQLNIIARQLASTYPETNEKVSLTVAPLWKAPYGAASVMGPVLLVLSGVTALVLLIACANLANLLLARATARRREVAIRLSLGARRGQLVRQLLTESLLLALLGGTGAALFGLWSWDLLTWFVPTVDLPMAFHKGLTPNVLGFTLALSLVTGLIFGLAPALSFSRPDVASALKGETGAPGSERKGWLRGALVITQVSLSLMLLIAAGLLIQSLRNAGAVNPGFNSRSVLLASLNLFPSGYTPETGRTFFRQLLDRLGALPGVESVSLARRVPLGFEGSSSTSVEVEGYQPSTNERPGAGYTEVGPDYLRTIGIQLLAGRDFNLQDDEKASRVIVVNGAMASRYWPGQSAVGKRVRVFGPDWCTVVGIARNIKLRALNDAPRPFLYLPVLQLYRPETNIHLRTAGDPAMLTALLRAAIRELDPQLPVFGIRTLEDHTGAATFAQRLGGSLLGVFGALALLLAAVGIYGVVRYSVSQRTREIGIRMALGAQRGNILRMIVMQGARLTAVGLFVGLVAAFFLTQFLATLLLNVSAKDPVTFAAVTLLLAAVALLASYLPARRATRVDPLEALRYE